MLDLGTLLKGKGGSKLRYQEPAKLCKTGVRPGMGPVVSWNITRTCNLRCVHCYSASENKKYENELSTEEAKAFIDDLAAFKVPALLLSGGEPMMRPDFFELAAYAASRGIRPTISTSGTMLTEERVCRIKDIGVAYVGISIDGMEEGHDSFRGHPGSFAKALQGIRNCVSAGQKVGLRFTISKRNYKEIPKIFQLVEDEGIDRLCFYHLVYSGRAFKAKNDDISHAQSRELMEYIIEKAMSLKTELLMVDNHADGVFLYLWLKKNKPELAQKVYDMLALSGGNRSGSAFANVDNIGNVHPDQFTTHHTLGNIRERKFSEIWTDDSIELLAGLRNRKPLIKGRCATCAYYEICGGNFRARAEAVRGDFWDSDPACYITDEEIQLK